MVDEKTQAATATAEPLAEGQPQVEAALPPMTGGEEEEETTSATPVAEKADEPTAKPPEPETAPAPQPQPQPQADSAYVLQLQRDLQLERQQRLQQEQEHKNADEIRHLTMGLENQGYTAEQVQGQVQRLQGLHQERQKLAEDAAKLQQHFHLAEMDMAAKVEVATHFAEQTGMPLKELLKYNNPTAMEQAAENYRLKAENVRLKQARVPAQRFESGVTTTSSPRSRDALMDRYNDGEDLTPDQMAVVFPQGR